MSKPHTNGSTPDDPISVLFPAIRAGLLRATITQADKWWYLSELAHQLGTIPSSVQRELRSLVGAGILEARHERGRAYFRADKSSRAYRSLRRLFVKPNTARTKESLKIRKTTARKKYTKNMPRLHFKSKPIARGDLVLKEYVTGRRAGTDIREQLWAKVVKVEFTQVCGDLIQASKYSKQYPVGRRVCVRDHEILELRQLEDTAPGTAMSAILMSRYDREKLYSQVWSHPVQKLAKEYGLSNSGLAKVCRSLKVPLPGRGYWAKRNAGKTVPDRPPLPVIDSNEQDRSVEDSQ